MDFAVRGRGDPAFGSSLGHLMGLGYGTGIIGKLAWVFFGGRMSRSLLK
jgi:hypothetical protein